MFGPPRTSSDFRGLIPMNIRPATLSDLPRITPLYYHANSKTQASDAESILRAMLERPQAEDHLLIAEDENQQLLGLAVSGADPQKLSGAALHLLSVSPDAFGRRLAGHLLKNLKSRLFTSRVSALWVRAEETSLSPFLRHGAVPVGRVPQGTPGRRESSPRLLLRLATGTQPTELQTQRLRLRAWRPEDYAPFRVLNADPQVNAHLPGPLSSEQSDALADRLHTKMCEAGFGYWAVECKEFSAEPQARFLGFVGLQSLRELPLLERYLGGPAFEVAWRLAPRFWNRGYATEAAQETLRFAFETLNVEEVVSFTTPYNLASQRVMVKLGMKRDLKGDFEHPRLPAGHPLRPHQLYRLSRSRWEDTR